MHTLSQIKIHRLKTSMNLSKTYTKQNSHNQADITAMDALWNKKIHVNASEHTTKTEEQNIHNTGKHTSKSGTKLTVWVLRNARQHCSFQLAEKLKSQNLTPSDFWRRLKQDTQTSSKHTGIQQLQDNALRYW